MINFFSSSDPFEILPGTASIAIGAPHDGSRPNVNADWGTGSIAKALAHQLDARAIVVSDLRHAADVNKDPVTLSSSGRRYAIRYQNELFAGWPSMLVEIHGHVSGKYDIEISTGFDLDANIAAEAQFIQRLELLRQVLPETINSRLGIKPTLGIWPLDREVKKTATNTFTFQKIRRARHLSGMEWYGLHIELSQSIRVARGTTAGRMRKLPPQMVEALASGLASGISRAFLPLPDPGSRIPTHAESKIGTYTHGPELSLIVARSPEDHTSENKVFLHPASFEHLAALPGDTVLISNGDDVLRSQAASSKLVRQGHIAMNQRIRSQVNTSINQKVSLARLVRLQAEPMDEVAQPTPEPEVLAHRVLQSDHDQLWLNSATCNQMHLTPGSEVTITPRANQASLIARLMEADESLPDQAAALSSRITDIISVTIGEPLHLKRE